MTFGSERCRTLTQPSSLKRRAGFERLRSGAISFPLQSPPIEHGDCRPRRPQAPRRHASRHCRSVMWPTQIRRVGSDPHRPHATGRRPSRPARNWTSDELFSALTISQSPPPAPPRRRQMRDRAKVEVAAEVRARDAASGRRLQGAPDQGRGRLLRSLRHRQGRQARQHGLQRRDAGKAHNAEAGEN